MRTLLTIFRHDVWVRLVARARHSFFALEFLLILSIMRTFFPLSLSLLIQDVVSVNVVVAAIWSVFEQRKQIKNISHSWHPISILSSLYFVHLAMAKCFGKVGVCARVAAMVETLLLFG